MAQQPTKKRKFHRHTQLQINELESVFLECSHPNDTKYNELSKKLGMDIQQVKYWFQNRRTLKKTQLKRHENTVFREDNDKIKAENYLLRTHIANPICHDCSGVATTPTTPTISSEQQRLRLENIRLKEEINRICSLANKELGRNLFSSPLASTSTPPIVTPPSFDPTIGQSNTVGGFDLGVLPNSTTSHSKSMYKEFAVLAMDELMTMACTDEPLWVKKIDDRSHSREVLNLEEYGRIAAPSLLRKPNGLAREATRASDIVVMDGSTLVELLMDVNRWTEAFTGMVGKGATIDVVSHGVNGTKDGTLQTMRAEFQAISAMIPIRHSKFLRLFKKQYENIWAVMDLTLDPKRPDGSSLSTEPSSMRLPSGCVIEDLGNGCSKVIWVENWLYDENSVNPLMQPMVRSGASFGAKRWIATLQRYCESVAILIASANLPPHPSITIAGKKSLLKLSERMINLYCGGISVGSFPLKWETISVNSSDHNLRIAMRKNSIEPGDTLGVSLTASTSLWLPVSRRMLFEFLANGATRSNWDVQANGGTMTELVHLQKTHIHKNSISVLRTSGYGGGNGGSLILQETWNDESSSVLVYATVDPQSMELVMTGGDSSFVGLLPSGFAIFPDGSDGVDDATGAGTSTGTGIGSGRGCIMTVGLQLLVSTVPMTRVRRKSIETVNSLLSSTIQRIKNAFHIV